MNQKSLDKQCKFCKKEFRTYRNTNVCPKCFVEKFIGLIKNET